MDDILVEETKNLKRGETNKMKNFEINKNAVKKLSMAVLITSSLMLGGCGSSNTDKPKDEPTTDVGTKDDEKIPFEEMTTAEMDVLKSGDIVTKLPDSEYLNMLGLDFLFVYEQWIKLVDEEYPTEPSIYYTKNYRKDGEASIGVNNVIESYEKYKLKEIVVGSMEYFKNSGTGDWYKLIDHPGGIQKPVLITSQEKIDQLNKGEIQYKK